MNTHLPHDATAAVVNRSSRRRLPAWLKRPCGGRQALEVHKMLSDLNLDTVCREAHCPNIGQCFEKRTATFMVLGAVCTRNCTFCAVHSGDPEPVDHDEPRRLAEAAARLNLRHVVITSVTRDDLDDEGAAHFAACITAVHERLPDALVEVLTPDFHARADCVATVVQAGPNVFNHNVETVERLSPVIRPQADYRRSLQLLATIRDQDAHMWTKSGIMVGMGETREDIRSTLHDLRNVDCNILTIGQYLQPSSQHRPVDRYVEPAEFDEIADEASQMAFDSVAAGPFVRSSYNAQEVFEQARKPTGGDTAAV